MLNIASVFYGTKMQDMKTARVLHIAGLFLAVSMVIKNSNMRGDVNVSFSKKKKGARNTVYWKAFLPKNRYI